MEKTNPEMTSPSRRSRQSKISERKSVGINPASTVMHISNYNMYIHANFSMASRTHTHVAVIRSNTKGILCAYKSYEEHHASTTCLIWARFKWNNKGKAVCKKSRKGRISIAADSSAART